MKKLYRILMVAEIVEKSEAEALEALDEFREITADVDVGYRFSLSRETPDELREFDEAIKDGVGHCFVPVLEGEIDPLDEDGDDEDDEDEPTEPEEDDIVTSDHVHFYSFDGTGEMMFMVGEGEDWGEAAKAYMDRVKFWPNLWWISDHGNPHLLDPYLK